MKTMEKSLAQLIDRPRLMVVEVIPLLRLVDTIAAVQRIQRSPGERVARL